MKKQSLCQHKKKVLVSVIGGHTCNKKVEQICIKLGKMLAKVGVFLVNGGLSGVMMAVSKGMESEGGVAIGILPNETK